MPSTISKGAAGLSILFRHLNTFGIVEYLHDPSKAPEYIHWLVVWLHSSMRLPSPDIPDLTFTAKKALTFLRGYMQENSVAGSYLNKRNTRRLAHRRFGQPEKSARFQC